MKLSKNSSNANNSTNTGLANVNSNNTVSNANTNNGSQLKKTTVSVSSVALAKK